MGDIIRFTILFFVTGFALGVGLMWLPPIRKLLTGELAKHWWIALSAGLVVAILSGGFAAFQLAGPPVTYVPDLQQLDNAPLDQSIGAIHGHSYTHSLRYRLTSGSEVSNVFALRGSYRTFSTWVGIESGSSRVEVKFEVFANSGRIAVLTLDLASPATWVSGPVQDASQLRIRMTATGVTQDDSVVAVWGDAAVA
jgi:hypothetical protein